MQKGKQIINEKLNKIKLYFTSINFKLYILVLLFILSNTSSFLLGYFSYEGDTPNLLIEKNKLHEHLPIYNPYYIVASRNGKKYYYLWCSYVSKIKDGNKIYFKSEVEAEKAGYKKAKSCK